MHPAREITCSNFDECFPLIKEILESSDFISFDAEFTGISSSTTAKNSLFDTSGERYLTVKKNIEDFIISQFGLTAFKYSRDDNKYMATSFLFYIIPRPIGSLERTFLVQSSAFEFLSKHDFNFNKFMQKGIGYLSVADSKMIGTDNLLKNGRTSQLNERLYETEYKLKNGPMWMAPNAITTIDEDLIKTELSRIELWLSLERQENDFLEAELVSSNEDVMDCLVLEIETAFPTKIEIVHHQESRRMIYMYRNSTPEKVKIDLRNKYLGFTRLFVLLTKVKKPIVGHNPFLDLMILYNQFNEPLPKSYSEFKKNIHHLFPRVFDTKHMSYVMRDEGTREERWESNELVKLFTYFQTGRGSYIAAFSPDVVLVNAPQLSYSETHAHEAGWDSYYTGFCFIRMMHFYAVKANAKCGMGPRPLPPQQHLHCVRMFQNCVNIPRANISHLCLHGPDPPTDKPMWLVIKATDNTRITVRDVEKHLAVNGEAKQLNKYTVIVAVSQCSAKRDIEKKLKGTGYQMQEYSRMKHSAMVRKIMWGSIVLTGSACALMLWPKLQAAIKDVPSPMR